MFGDEEERVKGDVKAVNSVAIAYLDQHFVEVGIVIGVYVELIILVIALWPLLGQSCPIALHGHHDG
jgi:hypothetical protein